MNTKCALVSALVLACIVVHCQASQIAPYTETFSGFAYPAASEEDPGKKNAMNKTPLDYPNRCKPGELFYPGDHLDDWVCDCRPRFIYYPEHDECYEAYRRGPCKPKEYLILPKSSVLPVCVQNPCMHDGYVKLGNFCYALDTNGPCPPTHKDNVVSVNESTLEVHCSHGMLATRFSDTDTKPTTEPAVATTFIDGHFYRNNDCFPGGRRWKHESCPLQVQYNHAIAAITDIYGPRN